VRDRDVRAELHTMLLLQHAHELDATRVLDELDLCGQVRVDVAVLNGELAGYELKSARDTLGRLPVQVRVYSQVLDKATLVVAACHQERALTMLPDWWGVIVASDDLRGATRLEWRRWPQANPGIAGEALIQLLWRSEVLEELSGRGLDHGYRGANRSVLRARLCGSLPLGELRDVVRERLKRRVGWRVAPSRPAGGAGSHIGATS
jgi:hypothetical protein